MTVDSNGYAQVSVNAGKTFAIDKYSNINGGGGPTLIPTTAGPTQGPISGKRTVIFIKKDTMPGQDLFVRGGIDHSRKPGMKQLRTACSKVSNQLLFIGCTSDATTSECAIPIRHITVVPSTFTTYTDWEVKDYYLDWYGAESGQGKDCSRNYRDISSLVVIWHCQ